MTGGATPFVSVIIPHLNQVEAAVRCLASVKAQDYPADRLEIILVDNGSTQSLAPVTAAFPDVTILHEQRPGPGLARNRGVEQAKGDILAFIDADCRAGEGWLRAIVAGLAAPDSTGAIGGDVRIDFVDSRRLTPLEAYEAVFAYRQKLYIGKQRFSGTGNLAMRPDIHRLVGPFGGIEIAEDRDWGRRAHAAGHPVRYRADMVIYHPARTNFAQMQTKWRRHVAHDLEQHRLTGGSRAKWIAHAAAVLLSAIPHSAMLLTSDRLHGLGNRLRGVAVLVRVRAYRFREMLAQAGGSTSAAADWNRAAR